MAKARAMQLRISPLPDFTARGAREKIQFCHSEVAAATSE
jgi:hypothetical protein